MYVFIYIWAYIYVHCIICLISQGSLVHRRDTQRSPSSFVPVEDIASWFSTSQAHRRFTSRGDLYEKRKTYQTEAWQRRVLEKNSWNLEDSKILQKCFRIHQTCWEKKAKVCRFAYGFHMSTTRNLSKVRQTIMPLAKPCILSTFDRRKVVWKAQHFPKEHLKCTETQCVFHSSKSYVFISSLRNAYHFST